MSQNVFLVRYVSQTFEMEVIYMKYDGPHAFQVVIYQYDVHSNLTRNYLNKHTTSDISRKFLVCDVNPASVGSVDILDPNWVFDVASYGARTSTVTVFTTKLDVFSSKFVSFSMIQYHLCGPDDVIWNDWRGLLKSRGDSSYHVNHHEILYRRMGKVKIQIIMHDIL